MKEKIKSVGDWFKDRESRKEKQAREITNIVSKNIDDIVIHAFDKLDFGFDALCEKENLKIDIYNLKLKLKDKDNCIKELQTKCDQAAQERDRVYEYLEKLVSVVKTNDEKLLKEIEDFKSSHWLVKEVPEDKATGKQTIKVKSGARTSKIMKQMKEGK